MNERGPNVMVEIYDDRIEICNSGGLPRGLSPEEFGKRSVLRNPRIAGMLHRADYIEKMGRCSEDAAAHERGRTCSAGVHIHELLHGYFLEACCDEW